MLWSTPEMPRPVALTVDGVAVDEVVVEDYLSSEWAYWCARNAAIVAERPAGEAFLEFVGAAGQRLEPLVGDVLLLREAEERWPELDEQEVDAFIEDMRRSVGEVAAALEKRYGVEGLRDHARRRLRVGRLLAELGAVVAEPTQEEVAAEWQRMLSEMELPEEVPEEEAAQYLPSFQEIEPRIREHLRTQRRDAAARDWIAQRRAGVEAVFTLADGSTLVLPSP